MNRDEVTEFLAKKQAEEVQRRDDDERHRKQSIADRRKKAEKLYRTLRNLLDDQVVAEHCKIKVTKDKDFEQSGCPTVIITAKRLSDEAETRILKMYPRTDGGYNQAAIKPNDIYREETVVEDVVSFLGNLTWTDLHNYMR